MTPFWQPCAVGGLPRRASTNRCGGFWWPRRAWGFSTNGAMVTGPIPRLPGESFPGGAKPETGRAGGRGRAPLGHGAALGRLAPAACGSRRVDPGSRPEVRHALGRRYATCRGAGEAGLCARDFFPLRRAPKRWRGRSRGRTRRHSAAFRKGTGLFALLASLTSLRASEVSLGAPAGVGGFGSEFFCSTTGCTKEILAAPSELIAAITARFIATA